MLRYHTSYLLEEVNSHYHWTIRYRFTDKNCYISVNLMTGERARSKGVIYQEKLILKRYLMHCSFRSSVWWLEHLELILHLNLTLLHCIFRWWGPGTYIYFDRLAFCETRVGYKKEEGKTAVIGPAPYFHMTGFRNIFSVRRGRGMHAAVINTRASESDNTARLMKCVWGILSKMERKMRFVLLFSKIGTFPVHFIGLAWDMLANFLAINK